MADGLNTDCSRGRLLLAASIGLLSSLSFLPLFPRFLYHWDEYQLSLARAGVSIAQHHPHPPGYYLFVLLERLVALLSPGSGIEPGRIVSAMAAGAACALLVMSLPAVRVRILAGFSLALPLLCWSAPLIAFHAVAPLTYMLEAFLWLAILLMIGRRPQGVTLYALAGFIGLAAGVRPTLLVWACVVVLIEMRRTRSWARLRAVVAVLIAVTLGVLAWLLPMLYETGGVEVYLAASRRLHNAAAWHRSIFEAPLSFLINERLPHMVSVLWSGSGVAAILPIFVCIARMRGDEAARQYDLLLWGGVIPFVFYALLIFSNPGYLTPVVLVLLAYGVLGLGGRLGERSSPAIPLVAAVCVLDLVFAILPIEEAATTRGVFAAYRENDAKIALRIAEIRRRYRPEETLLAATRQRWVRSFRTVMYYLPEYTAIQLLPDAAVGVTSVDKMYLTAREHRLWASGPLNVHPAEGLPDLDKLKHVVMVFPDNADDFMDESCKGYRHAIRLTQNEALLEISPPDPKALMIAGGVLVCEDSTVPSNLE